MNYEIKTHNFEGSLELLLNLIEKRKLFINDISLAEISDDYVEYMRNAGFSIKNSSEFIFIASTLMLIKSKSLLPNLNLTLEEEKNIGELEERLKLYKEMKDLSTHVDKRFGENIIFSRGEIKNDEDIIFSPDEKITKDNLFGLVVGLITKLPKKEIVPKRVVKKVVSLEETIDNLTKRIKDCIKMSFNEFSKIGKTEKINVVVSFLAMLELVKQGSITVNQNKNFSDIDMENKEVKTPSYC